MYQCRPAVVLTDASKPCSPVPSLCSPVPSLCQSVISLC